VEGFSNPLWVVVMAAVHLLPVSSAKVSLVIQVLGAVLLRIPPIVIAVIAAS
jgi:hypothetical protein